jgi:hypothetical protein
MIVQRIGGEPGLVVPALTRALKDPNVNVFRIALLSLSHFAGRARSAFHEIVKMLNEPRVIADQSLTEQLQTALWQIAPERTGYPLVVEDATPAIANGVITQAVKFSYNGNKGTRLPSYPAGPCGSRRRPLWDT